MPIPRWMALTVAATMLLGAAGPARAQQVEHVFIFVIDGLRASEAFDDAEHGFVGPLADTLLPLGSLLTYLEIRGQTLTLPAHQVIMTGNYADYSNTPVYAGRQFLAPRTPTLFEAYRQQTGAPADSTWIVSNTPLVGVDCKYSLMPGYGPDLGASFVTTYETSAVDTWVWDETEAIMAGQEIGVLLVNLHETDLAGHADEWWRYEERAGEAASDLIAFWEALQADPTYAGSSLMIVTTDHGRHSDGVSSGWLSHGCQCQGCRKAFMLMLGPGVRSGVVSDMACSYLDVAPTVAHMMGLDFPYHRGRVLAEILEDGESIAPTLGGTFRPWSLKQGDLVVRLAEIQDSSLPDDQGAHRISVELSEDGGQTWTDHTTAPGTAIQYSPVAWTDGETVIVGWLEIAAQGDYWYVRLRRLGVESGTWEEVLYEPMIASSTPVGNLVLVEDDEGQLVLLENNSRNERIRMWASQDTGQTWAGDWAQYEFVRHFPRDLGLVEIGDAWIVAYSAHAQFDAQTWPTDPNENTEIYWVRSEDQGATWSDELAVTAETSPSIQPRMALTPDGVLHMVWADYRTGAFQLYHAGSTDDGMTFSPPAQLTFDGLGAWEPAVAVDGDRVFVAWSEVPAVDQAVVHAAELVDGALTDDQELSDPARVARTPYILPQGDCTSLVSWSQGDLVGAWELASAQVVTAGFPATGATATVEPDVVEPGADATQLRFALQLDIGADDNGVLRVELAAPDVFELVGTGTAAFDGDLMDAAWALEGQTLWITLADALVTDGELALVVDVVPPADPVEDATFALWLHEGLEGCATPVDGDLAVSTTAAGDDDDADDDDTDQPGDDDSAGDGTDCTCRLGGRERAFPLAAIMALILLLTRRRAGLHT